MPSWTKDTYDSEHACALPYSATAPEESKYKDKGADAHKGELHVLDVRVFIVDVFERVEPVADVVVKLDPETDGQQTGAR